MSKKGKETQERVVEPRYEKVGSWGLLPIVKRNKKEGLTPSEGTPLEELSKEKEVHALICGEYILAEFRGTEAEVRDHLNEQSEAGSERRQELIIKAAAIVGQKRG